MISLEAQQSNRIRCADRRCDSRKARKILAAITPERFHEWVAATDAAVINYLWPVLHFRYIKQIPRPPDDVFYAREICRPPQDVQEAALQMLGLPQTLAHLIATPAPQRYRSFVKGGKHNNFESNRIKTDYTDCYPVHFPRRGGCDD